MQTVVNLKAKSVPYWHVGCSDHLPRPDVAFFFVAFVLAAAFFNLLIFINIFVVFFFFFGLLGAGGGAGAFVVVDAVAAGVAEVTEVVIGVVGPDVAEVASNLVGPDVVAGAAVVEVATVVDEQKGRLSSRVNDDPFVDGSHAMHESVADDSPVE